MNPHDIKEKIRIAHEAVVDESEPYKIESYKIILKYLLESHATSNSFTSPPIQIIENAGGILEDDALVNLSKKCNLSMEQLKNILDVEDNQFILLKKIVADSDSKKQAIASQIILTAYMKGMNQEWTSGSVLRDLVEKNGLGEPKNLATNLKKESIFRMKGQLKGSQYSLTIEGWQEGIKLISDFATGGTS